MHEAGQPNAFEPLEILRLLVARQVEFVVIGGVAGALLGSSVTTSDLDIVPGASDENLLRLANLLYELDARLRREGEPEELHRIPSGDWLRSAAFWNLETTLGHFDVVMRPTAGGGYAELAGSALELQLSVGPVLVAALDELIAMKEAAGRPKDEPGLRFLRWLRDHPAEE